MKSKTLSTMLLGTSVSAIALPEPGWGPPAYPTSSPTPNTCPAKTVTTTSTLTSTCYETITSTSTCYETTTSISTLTSCPTPSSVPISTPSSTHISTPSSTPTPSPSGACTVVNPLCRSSGWSVDYYANPFGGYGYPPSGLGPNYYISENLKPLNHSTTAITYIPDQSPPANLPVVYPGSTYDDGQAPYSVGWRIDVAGMSIDANNYTLVYSGLYKAGATGSHSFCAAADNIVDVFFGRGDAFPCGLGKTSADTTPELSAGIAGGDFTNPGQCFEVDLVQGAYYPVRLVEANFQGPTAFGFSVAPPGAAGTEDLAGKIFPPSCALL